MSTFTTKDTTNCIEENNQIIVKSVNKSTQDISQGRNSQKVIKRKPSTSYS